MKKWLTMFLALVMVIASLSACGQVEVVVDNNSDAESEVQDGEENAEAAEEAENESGEFDAKAICDGVTITIAVAEKPRIADWKENDMTKYIEDALGVNLAFEVYPAADFNTKINTMVAAGDKLPDLIFGPDDTYKNWINEGALMELSKYYEDENLSANIRIASEGAGYDIGTYMKNGDGEIYGFPSLEQGYGMESWQRFWVYEPWCEQLDKEVPTTIDEYYELCKLIASTDMNGDGDTSDERAIIGAGFNEIDNGWSDWFEPLMSAYVYAWDENFMTVDADGTVGLAYTTDAWKEGLKSIKRFFDDGLIDTSILTNTPDDVKASLYSELPTCFSFTGWIYEGADLNIKNDYTWTHLTNNDGSEGFSQYKPKLPGVAAVMSVDCENPEAAFLVCDLMCSEYLSFSTRYGTEGVHWAYWDQVLEEDVLNPDEYAAQGAGYDIVWVSSYADTTFWSSTETQTASWLQAGPFVRTAAQQLVRARQMSAESEEDKLKIEATTIDYGSKDAGIANKPEKVLDFAPLTADETAETSEILIDVNNYVAEMTAKFLTGQADIDGEWDSYIAQLETLGIETLVNDYQAGYDRVH